MAVPGKAAGGYDWTPTRIVVLYAVFSMSYLFLSDYFLAMVIEDDAMAHMAFSFAKGAIFILITSIFLYILIARGRESVARSKESLRETEAKFSAAAQRSQEMQKRTAVLENEMQGLLGRLDVGVFQLDQQGRMLAGNQAFFRIIDAEPEAALGKDLFDRILPSETSRSMRSEVLATARLSKSEVDLRTFAGVTIVASMSGGLGRLESGKEVIEGVLEDVTERKKVESDLAMANATLEAIIESSPAAIAVVDSDANVRTWNASAERLFLLPRREVMGARFPMALTESPGQESTLDLLGKGEKVVDAETEAEVPGGRRMSISLSAAPLHGPGGELAGAVVVMLDISGRKAAEEERRRAYEQIDRNIEQFAVLVDSIRNPLTVIVGEADMGGGERMRVITEQAERIEGIIKQLDAGWIESEKVRQLLKKAT